MGTRREGTGSTAESGLQKNYQEVPGWGDQVAVGPRGTAGGPTAAWCAVAPTRVKHDGAVGDAEHLVDEALVSELRAGGAQQIHRPVQHHQAVHRPRPGWRQRRPPPCGDAPETSLGASHDPTIGYGRRWPAVSVLGRSLHAGSSHFSLNSSLPLACEMPYHRRIPLPYLRELWNRGSEECAKPCAHTCQDHSTTRGATGSMRRGNLHGSFSKLGVHWHGRKGAGGPERSAPVSPDSRAASARARTSIGRSWQAATPLPTSRAARPYVCCSCSSAAAMPYRELYSPSHACSCRCRGRERQ